MEYLGVGYLRKSLGFTVPEGLWGHEREKLTDRVSERLVELHIADDKRSHFSSTSATMSHKTRISLFTNMLGTSEGGAAYLPPERYSSAWLGYFASLRAYLATVRKDFT
jgi:hypothetical protein